MVGLTKSEQKCLSSLRGGKRLSLLQSVGAGILFFVLIQLTINVVPRGFLLFGIAAMYVFVICLLIWERFILCGIVMKLQERIKELELTSEHRGN
jgi:hypothetical protein